MENTQVKGGMQNMNRLERTLKKYLALGPNQRRVVSLAGKPYQQYSFEDTRFLDARYPHVINRYYNPAETVWRKFDQEGYRMAINECVNNEADNLLGKVEQLHLGKYLAGAFLVAIVGLVGACGGGMHIVPDEERE